MAMPIRSLTLGVVLAVLSFGAVQAQDTPRGDPKAGLVNFKKLGCYTCHGIIGQGTLRDGPHLNAAALGFPAVLAQLRNPRYEMPIYTASQISDAGVADIFAYLSSIPKGPDPKSIKQLQ
ncbi:MAG TPA: cytochrome c [Micropepsaceae bacterium]|jgi:ubiquinol-cytochrome c reductase cytochrome c subunit